MPLDSTTQITISGTNGQSFSAWDESTGEEKGSGQVREVFSIKQQEQRGERRLLCDWNDRIGICIALLGTSVLSTTGNVYYDGAAYPDFTAWVCQRVEITGHGLPRVGPNGMIAFERARLRAVHAPPDYGSGGPASPNVNLDFASNVVAMETDTPWLKWSDDAKLVPPSAAPALRFTTIMMSYRLVGRPTLDNPTIASLVDHVNSGPFEGADAEKVVFRGAKSQWRVGPSGATLYDITLAFEWHPYGWSMLPKAGVWTPVTKLDGTKPFPTADLSVLLR